MSDAMIVSRLILGAPVNPELVAKLPRRGRDQGAVLEAPPGARLCFLGDLAVEMDGKMSPAFNVMDGEPIRLDEEGRSV